MLPPSPPPKLVIINLWSLFFSKVVDPQKEKYTPVHLQSLQSTPFKSIRRDWKKKNPSIALVDENRELRKAVSRGLGKAGRNNTTEEVTQCLHHSHTFPNLPHLASDRRGRWSGFSSMDLLQGGRGHLHQLNVVFLSQSFSVASACNIQKNIFLRFMVTKHLQRKKHRGYSIHQQLRATLGQKHGQNGAWGKVYSTSSSHCIPIFSFIHCLSTLSFKMVTDCMQRGRKDFFFKKISILIALIDNVLERKTSLKNLRRRLIPSQKPCSNSKSTQRSMLCDTESTPGRYLSRH